MLKKSLVALMIFMLFAMMAGTSVFAESSETPGPEVAKALTDVEKTNDKIYAEIDQAQVKAEEMYAKYTEDFKKETNVEKQQKLTAEYNEKVTDLIAKLDIKTQLMTHQGAEKATEAGVEVDIVWIPVRFADRIAMIDPIIVISW